MDNTDLRITLTPSEVALLDDILGADLQEMRFELARTDDRRYRAQVRDRLEQLEAIVARVSALAAPEEAPSVRS